MRATLATLAFAGYVAAQAVTSAIAPPQAAPSGCYANYDGTFEIGPVNVSSSSKRDLDTRNTQLGITLKNGILTDPFGRTGYIASNQQFQFDGPPQAGAIWTAGFSVCTNGRLALGNDETWWKCLSGNFYNLYYESIGGQCIESYIIVQGIDGATGPVVSAQTGAGSTATTAAAEPSTSSSSTSSAQNATMSGSSASTIVSTTSGVTVIGGKTTTTHGTVHITTKTGMMTGATTGMSSGSATTAASSGSSASSSGLAPAATLKSEMMGLAAGLLALAAL